MTRRRGLLSLFTSPPPEVGVEISSQRVSAVAIVSAADGASIARHASAELPPGAVVPALNAHNIADKPAVVAAVRHVLEGVGRPRRVGLVIPDPAARLSVVKFDTVPARSEERDQLVRFQVRKSAPFPIDSAHLSIVPGRQLEGGAQEFVVAVARRDVIEEYESVCEAASAHAGIVDLSTCSLMNLLLAADRRNFAQPPTADWMLVHLAGDYSTTVIVRGEVPILFRNRVAEAEGPLVDLVHQGAMYYEDRLEGRGLTRVVVVADDTTVAEVVELERVLKERFPATGIEHLDLASAVRLADRIAVPPDVAASLAPPAGLVLREVS